MKKKKTLQYAIRDANKIPVTVTREHVKTLIQGAKIIHKHRMLTGCRAIHFDNGVKVLTEYQTAKQIANNR